MKKLNTIPNATEHRFDGAMFSFKSPIDNGTLKIIASFGLGWNHVSVSRKNRCPNWKEMCFIKDIFFEDDEVAIQYHPQKKDYVNIHSNCLHLWQPQNVEIPMPDIKMI